MQVFSMFLGFSNFELLSKEADLQTFSSPGPKKEKDKKDSTTSSKSLLFSPNLKISAPKYICSLF